MYFKDISIIDNHFEVQHHRHLITENGYITYLDSQPPPQYHGTVYRGSNQLVAPGFFNTHCHLPMVLLRGYGEGLPLHRWLNERMFPYEKLLTNEDVYWGSLLGIAELVAGGTVSVTDMYMFMPAICEAVEQSGFKANLSHGCSSSLGAQTALQDIKGYEGLLYLIDYANSHPDQRIIADAAIHAEYTSEQRLVQEIAQFAAENNLRIQVHLSETHKEHEEAKLRRGGRTAAQWFAQCGLFDQPTTAAHCVWLEPEDMALLAEKKVTVAHCPASNLKLGSGIAPLQKLLDAGVSIAIGTDGAASNNNLSMLQEVQLAALLHKGNTGDPLFLSTSQALQIATRNGALAQGRLDSGILQVGMRADLVVYDMDKPHLSPTFDMAANLLYAANNGDVALTMIDGRVVYRDGEFKTIDIEQAAYHVRRIAGEKQRALQHSR